MLASILCGGIHQLPLVACQVARHARAGRCAPLHRETCSSRCGIVSPYPSPTRWPPPGSTRPPSSAPTPSPSRRNRNNSPLPPPPSSRRSVWLAPTALVCPPTAPPRSEQHRAIASRQPAHSITPRTAGANLYLRGLARPVPARGFVHCRAQRRAAGRGEAPAPANAKMTKRT